VSKRITPHESAKAKPGKHHYAFVDLESKEEVHRAIETLQGLEWEGARLRVQMPTGIPSKIIRRSTPWDKDRKAA
jgi:hypothetical protein